MEGHLVRAEQEQPWPKLLGGSSKLAKLAEERRKKAAAAAEAPSTASGGLSSLDRLSKPKDIKENKTPSAKPEPKKYPIRKTREPTPPPREPTPPPAEEEADEQPDLRASPTSFGRTLSASRSHVTTLSLPTIKDMFGHASEEDPFKGPSPDDTILRAQQQSKSLGK